MHIKNKVYNNDIILKSNTSNSINLDFIENFENSINQINPKHPIIIKGNDDFFCSGLDLNFSNTLNSNELKNLINKFEALLFKILRLDTITCALIKGHCIGGGLIIALACDKICLYPSNKKIGLNKKYLNIELPPLPELIIKNKLSLKNRNKVSNITLSTLKKFKLDNTVHDYYLDRNNIDNELVSLNNKLDFLSIKKQKFNYIYNQYLKTKHQKFDKFLKSWFNKKSILKREKLIESFNKN